MLTVTEECLKAVGDAVEVAEAEDLEDVFSVWIWGDLPDLVHVNPVRENNYQDRAPSRS